MSKSTNRDRVAAFRERSELVRLEVSVTEECVAEFKKLAGNLTRGEFLTKLIAAYKEQNMNNNTKQNYSPEALSSDQILSSMYLNARVSQGFGNSVLRSDLTKHFNDNGGVSDVADYYNDDKTAFALLAELAGEFCVTFKADMNGMFSLAVGWPLNHKHASELKTIGATEVDQSGYLWVSVTDVEPSIAITKATVAMLDQMRDYGYTPMFYGYYHTWDSGSNEPEFNFE